MVVGKNNKTKQKKWKRSSGINQSLCVWLWLKQNCLLEYIVSKGGKTSFATIILILFDNEF